MAVFVRPEASVASGAGTERREGRDILVFSDGTGQFGGLAPDQRLSNVYKMFRAMRPGSSSAIPLSAQVAFYDAGLRTSERRGNVLQRIRTVAGSAREP